LHLTFGRKTLMWVLQRNKRFGDRVNRPFQAGIARNGPNGQKPSFAFQKIQCPTIPGTRGRVTGPPFDRARRVATSFLRSDGSR
jgi:hypothetical protein